MPETELTPEQIIEPPHLPVLLELMGDERLTMEQKTFLRLRYHESLPEPEVANQMEMTVEQLHNFEQMTFRHIRGSAFRDPVIEEAFDESTE